MIELLRVLSRSVLLSILFYLLIATSIAASVFASDMTNPIVRKVTIEGHHYVDEDVIRGLILKTQVGEPLIEQRILDDLYTLDSAGLFQYVEAKFEPYLGGVEVVYIVLENPIVNDIIFKDDEKFPLTKFCSGLRVQSGSILNILDLHADIEELVELAKDHYGYVLFPSHIEIDELNNIHIGFNPARLSQILISGNQKTKDFVIHRELLLQPAELFNLKDVERGLRRVLMLGFFDEITTELTTCDVDPSSIELNIHVEERKTGSATFGVSYSTQDRLVGFVEAADENFLGRGQRVNATARFGKRLQEYEFGFSEPYIDKTGTSLGINLYRRSRPVNTTNAETDELLEVKRTTNGGDLTLGRPFSEFTRGRLTFKLENNFYDLPSEPIKDDLNDYKNRTIGFGVNTNTADHPFNPTQGYRNDAYLELGTRLLGGDMQYAKLRLEHSRYFEVKDGGYVLAVRGLGGRLLGGDLGRENFKIGGADTLRGYAYGGYPDEDGRLSLEGDHMLVMNAEFRFPIVEKVTGVVFTDWGTTWNQGESMGLADLANSYGLGVRLDTPLGLLRLDYGWGKNAKDERKGQFYFGFGQMF